MKIQDVCQKLQLTKKAIYYYEKQGLLHIQKDKNGYRHFTQEDLERCHEIVLYRKWDIAITDIKYLLDLPTQDKKIYLKELYERKVEDLSLMQNCLDTMYDFINNDDNTFSSVNQQVDTQDLLQAISECLPGIYGYFFCTHFQPYLHVRITSSKQQKAYMKMVKFWDEFEIRLPLSYYILYHYDQKKCQQTWQSLDEYKTQLVDAHDAYEQMYELCEKNYKLSKKLWYRLINYPQRRMKIKLRDAGYYDVFIPAMRELSDEYNAYYEKWMKLNERVCQDLGIYYDSHFRIRKKL